MIEQIENKQMDISFALKALEEDGVFSGYASVFDVVDSQRDVIKKGAFSNSIHDRIDGVKLLWQHQVDQPIGCFTKIIEDSYGLFVEGKLLLDVQRGKEAYSLLKSGALKGLSIGYAVVDAHIDDEGLIRIITEVDLFEVSLVTFPANEGANVTNVKGKLPKSTREFEKFLRKSGFSRTHSKSIVAKGFKESLQDDFFELEESIAKLIEIINS